MDRRFLAIGAILGFLAVAAGAFGAHTLKDKLSPDRLASFETAARYQMVHALALLAAGLWATREASRTVRAAAWLFIAGIVVFSGSLYVLSVTGIRWLGAVTPIGGVALLAAWALLVWAALFQKPAVSPKID